MPLVATGRSHRPAGCRCCTTPAYPTTMMPRTVPNPLPG